MKLSKVYSNYSRRSSDEPSLRHGMRMHVAMSPNIVCRESVQDILRKAARKGFFSESPSLKSSLFHGPTSESSGDPDHRHTGRDTGVGKFPLRKSQLADPRSTRAFAAPNGAPPGPKKVLTRLADHPEDHLRNTFGHPIPWSYHKTKDPRSHQKTEDPQSLRQTERQPVAQERGRLQTGK
jgi:hypothetical protein